LHAVATAADVKVGKWDVDDESVDATLGLPGAGGRLRLPKLDVQLKCTSQSLLRNDGVHFPLKRKNYDDLREATPILPHILVVLVVPEPVEEWLTFVREERMCLHRHAWWMSLAGAEERAGVETPTVTLPRAQVFDVAALTGIIGRIARGEHP
jgi:Domain of unknown function (DUF4365)